MENRRNNKDRIRIKIRIKPLKITNVTPTEKLNDTEDRMWEVAKLPDTDGMIRKVALLPDASELLGSDAFGGILLNTYHRWVFLKIDFILLYF